MAAILLFDSWPSQHSGPRDLEESESLGGLLAQVQIQNTVAETNEDGKENEDHADRRHALEDRALGLVVDDPLLLGLDELVAQL